MGYEIKLLSYVWKEVKGGLVMIYEEYEMYEKGDKVKVENCSDYDGMRGVVIQDQCNPEWDVKVKLENGEEIYVNPYELVFKG